MSYHFISSALGMSAPIVGEFLGRGFHGDVWTVPGVEDKVIKFSRIVEAMTQQPLKEFYNNLTEVLAEQQNNAYPCYVKIFNISFLYEGIRFHPKNPTLGQKFILYSTLMEKLIPLSLDEKKLFDTITTAKSPIDFLVASQAGWLNFDQQKVMTFHNQIESTPIKHGDYRSPNIMKDSEGNFKLIDLDFATIKPKKN